MNRYNVLAFVCGAAAGAVGAWYFAKKHYERIAQEEIDSVKETFRAMTNRYQGPEDKNEANQEPVIEHSSLDKPDITEYARKLSEQGYTNYSNSHTNEDGVTVTKIEHDPEATTRKPYVIRPDQYGEFDDYDQISLMYYADDKLADDNDELVEGIEDVVGFEPLTHFGEFDDDSVFVRNDRLKVDYEILRSELTYEEILQRKPYLREVIHDE